jgi:hypothetical protein
MMDNDGAPRIWLASTEGRARRAPLCAQEIADLHQLAVMCDNARRQSRDVDIRIALAIFPALRLLVRVQPGVWARPNGSHERALRYSSSTAAAMTLVPEDHWIECNPRAGGRIEILGPGDAGVVGWGSNDHFPLAACAAALRARASLAADRPKAIGRHIDRAPQARQQTG